ncbi:hypothetical protein PsorP6_015386 [Peronosclerospora sorghi]|uniref:Uncharacterized protein n=1 Tax=Peronosclerospora sorghi TaxID=230839 RepID=A0ACC0WNP5_9STRA|nr:hypothetical protein PsorP6_015386 [Peronosclerospora sorghi]
MLSTRARLVVSTATYALSVSGVWSSLRCSSGKPQLLARSAWGDSHSKASSVYEDMRSCSSGCVPVERSWEGASACAMISGCDRVAASGTTRFVRSLIRTMGVVTLRDDKYIVRRTKNSSGSSKK